MKASSLLCLLTLTITPFLLSPSAIGQSFQSTIYNPSGATQDVVVADVNEDGKPDLLTVQNPVDPEGGGAVIFLNRGDGTFAASGEIIPNGPNRVVVADFNGNGIPVFATQSCTSGGVTLLTYTRDPVSGAFNEIGGADIDFPDPPFVTSCIDAMAAITIAGDTLPSVLVSTDDTQVTIFRNDGTGHFPSQQSVFGAPGMRLAGASAGDFNGDHLQDIAAVSTNPNGGPQEVVIFYQNPDGSFQPPVTVFSTDATLQFTQAVDLNNNGSDDLVVPFFGGADKRAGVVALTDLVPGEFRSTVLLANPIYTSAGQKATAIHSQGKRHALRGILAPFSPDPSTGVDSVFAFFPAHGDTWGKPVYFDIPNGKSAQAVVTADFNGDGRPDFAGVDNSNELLVFLNITTDRSCGFPDDAGVRICSPVSESDSDVNSRTAEIHASASGGALPIAGMKALIDDKPVAESSTNTLDASVPAEPGRHTLTVSASDPNGRVYQSSVEFHVRSRLPATAALSNSSAHLQE